MAPMFLVSNEPMMREAIRSGIMGVFPSLNYRGKGELKGIIQRLHEFRNKGGYSGNFGVNLIVQKSNPLYLDHLAVCEQLKVPFYITSLGNPAEVIKRAHAYGARVYCDVTNLTHASKAASMNCDGFIAVGQGAGGHAGPHPLSVLIPALKKKVPEMPVIAAGGIADGSSVIAMLASGAAGVSIGTRFIASAEATVVTDYKNAIVESGMDDIVLTEKLSGTPCTIINTPDARRMGYRQNFFEKFLNRNPTTKKYFKMLVQVRGMRKLEQAVKPGNYDNLWCAGKSVELVSEIKSCEQIILDIDLEMKQTMNHLNRVYNGS